VLNAPVSPEQTSYPVVIMRAGASAFTADYTVLAEDLASHGYIVVGLDAPYRTFLVVLPDGGASLSAFQLQISTWPAMPVRASWPKSFFPCGWPISILSCISWRD
jgi:Platelet-activating factor acetylhydrolase, isoform II